MSEREKHPPYWFFHEYLDEERRMRVNKVTSDSEGDARKMHKQACAFLWVTHHQEPSVSPLFRLGDGRDVAIVPGHRKGQPYSTVSQPVPMPEYLRKLVRNVRIGDEAALSGVRAADEWDAVLRPPSPPRTRTQQDGFDTPF